MNTPRWAFLRSRSRAKVVASVAVLSLLTTMVVVAPYSLDAEAAAAAAAADNAAPEPDSTSDESPTNEVTAAADSDEAEPVFEVLVPDTPFGLTPASAQDQPTFQVLIPDADDTAEPTLIASVPAIDPSIPSADLSVSIVAERDPVLSDSFLSYTVQVTNDGPAQAENVVVSATLPVSASFLEMSGCYLANATFPDCHLNEIPAGESRSFELMTWINPDGGGLQDATVTVSSQTADPDPSNNTATIITTINTRATWFDLGSRSDLSVTLDVNDERATAGTITYTATVRNAGPGNATDVALNVATAPQTTRISATVNEPAPAGAAPAE